MKRDTDRIASATAAVRAAWPTRPRVGLILGSGLGELAGEIDVQAAIDGGTIPHCVPTTALSHRGQWICGTLAGTPVIAVQGRVHGYEGHSAQQAALPVRIMSALGAETLVITNACGGLNPKFQLGDLMVIEDQINFTFANPLVGPHDPSSGIGYPDMSQPYDPALIEQALAVARRRNIVAHRGTYVGVLGPNYETRAEYRFFRRIGGDGIGMSSVWESIVAAQCGLRVLGLSVVTNVSNPDQLKPTDGERVVAAAAAAEPKLRTIVRDAIAALPAHSR